MPSMQAYEVENSTEFFTNAALYCLYEDGNLNSVWQNKQQMNLEADKIREQKEK